MKRAHVCCVYERVPYPFAQRRSLRFVAKRESTMTEIDRTRSEAERKHAGEAMREQNELLKVLTEHAKEFIRFHDLEGRSVYASPSVERLHGRAPTTLFECAKLS